MHNLKMILMLCILVVVLIVGFEVSNSGAAPSVFAYGPVAPTSVAKCPRGTNITGGGYQIPAAFAGAAVVDNEPFGDGWTAADEGSYGNGVAEIVAIAVCR